MRNYETGLSAKGFTIRFFCKGAKECTPAGSTATFWEAGNGQIGMPTTWDTTVYLLAERDAPEGRVTVGMLGVETKATKSRPLTPHVAVTVVESKPMETDKIAVVTTSEMQQALECDGRIAIYGIHSDFDTAEITPESEPYIAQLAALLKENPKLKV